MSAPCTIVSIIRVKILSIDMDVPVYFNVYISLNRVKVDELASANASIVSYITIYISFVHMQAGTIDVFA